MSAYEHGSQDISGHQQTFTSIMQITVWSGALIGFATLYLTMVFAAGQNWFTSLLIVFALSILTGMGLKRSSAWYVTMTVVTVITSIIGFAVSLIAGML